jgi:hypothetical protein
MCSKRLPTGVIPHSHLGILLTTPRINKQNPLADLGVRASLGGGFLAPLACFRVILGDAFSEVIEHPEVLLRRANPWVACVGSAYRSAVEMSLGGKTGACPEGENECSQERDDGKGAHGGSVWRGALRPSRHRGFLQQFCHQCIFTSSSSTPTAALDGDLPTILFAPLTLRSLAGCSPPASCSHRSDPQRTPEDTPRVFTRCGLAGQPF